jgi:putative ABC transport system substrate-binding protein
MKRRDFIAAFGGTAVWPLMARAQQPKRRPTIGFLGAGTTSAGSQWAAAFVQRLRELNWIEDRTVAIEFRWADGTTSEPPKSQLSSSGSRSMSSSPMGIR